MADCFALQGDIRKKSNGRIISSINSWGDSIEETLENAFEGTFQDEDDLYPASLPKGTYDFNFEIWNELDPIENFAVEDYYEFSKSIKLITEQSERINDFSSNVDILRFSLEFEKLR